MARNASVFSLLLEKMKSGWPGVDSGPWDADSDSAVVLNAVRCVEESMIYRPSRLGRSSNRHEFHMYSKWMGKFQRVFGLYSWYWMVLNNFDQINLNQSRIKIY